MHILIYKVGIKNYMETKAGQITDHILLSWILANYTLHTDDGKWRILDNQVIVIH